MFAVSSELPALNGENRVYAGLCLVVVGLIMLLVGFAGSSDVFVSIITFGGGLSLVCIGLLDLFKSLDLWQVFKQFRRDERGLGWQILVFVAGVVVFAVAWFVVAWPTDIIYNIMTSMYVFDGFNASVIFFMRGLISLMVGVCLLSLIIWLWVQSNRNQEASYF